MQIVNPASATGLDELAKSGDRTPDETGADLSLASFGEILNAYSARRSTAGRRRRRSVPAEMFPWRDALAPAPVETPPAPVARKISSAVPPRPPTASPKPKSVSGRCECGICPRCKDNARWERIFEERFADASYYQQLHIRSSSPLSRCR